MSKRAEEAAWKWATENNVDPFSMGQVYGTGYEQAEKDLALTIDDLELLHAFLYAVKNNKQGCFTFTRLRITCHFVHELQNALRLCGIEKEIAI